MENLDVNTVSSIEVSPEILSDWMNRTVVSVLNPRWERADHSILVADVLFAELGNLGHVPFSTTANADTPHGRDVWDKALRGEYGTIAKYVAPVPTPSEYPLSFDQFRTMLEVIEKQAVFAEAIETLTPASKKIMMRNTYNNQANTFGYDTELIAVVAPMVWGENWRDELSPSWLEAKDY